MARWLQDISFVDLVEAGLSGTAVWVARRTRIAVESFPRFAETVRLSTWCSALARSAAERCTTLRSEHGAVEAVTLWVQLSEDGRRPVRLSERFRQVYEPSTNGRRARTGHRHPSPPVGLEGVPWHFRRADLDLAEHVNNAAYWQVLEEELVVEESLRRIDAEVEYRGGTSGELGHVLCQGGMRWIVEPSGELLASAVVSREEGHLRAAAESRRLHQGTGA